MSKSLFVKFQEVITEQNERADSHIAGRSDSNMTDGQRASSIFTTQGNELV